MLIYPLKPPGWNDGGIIYRQISQLLTLKLFSQETLTVSIIGLEGILLTISFFTVKNVEQPVFDFAQLISEVGGTVGLFLGFSLVQMIVLTRVVQESAFSCSRFGKKQKKLNWYSRDV